MTDPIKEEWAWSVPFINTVHRGFSSKDDALAAAKDHYESHVMVTLGTIEYLEHLHDFLPDGLDDLLETLDNAIADSEEYLMGLVGPLVELSPHTTKREAQDALTEMWRTFAGKYLTTSAWTFKEVEDVNI